MTATNAICKAVIDGNMFQTEGGSLIKLADVVVPPVNKPGFEKPKEALEQLVLGKLLSFQEVSKESLYITANVWVGSVHVNSHMQGLFPPGEV